MPNAEYFKGHEDECPPLWYEPEALHNLVFSLEEMEDWYEKAHARFDIKIANRSISEFVDEEDVSEEFEALVREWKDATWAMGSVKRRTGHSSYLKIIGMGPSAIPFLLKELRREPDYWFCALEAITRQDPAPEGANMKQLVVAWLEWGERRGYPNSR